MRQDIGEVRLYCKGSGFTCKDGDRTSKHVFHSSRNRNGTTKYIKRVPERKKLEAAWEEEEQGTCQQQDGGSLFYFMLEEKGIVTTYILKTKKELFRY